MKKTSTFKAVFPIGNSNVLKLPVPNLVESIQFYEKNLGFTLQEKRGGDSQTAILRRDEVEIGLTENGDDPWQHSCYFQVSDLVALYEELKNTDVLDLSEIQEVYDENGHYFTFFLRDADGLCYCVGEL